MLDELGPTFVKFGQLLSTRPDLVPADIVEELRKLQDDVSPVPVRSGRAGHRGGARADRRAGIPRASTRRRSPPPRSGRCTGRRSRTARTSSSRCNGPTHRVRSSPIFALHALRRARSPASAVGHLDFIDSERARRRVRPVDPRRARLPPGGGERRDVPPELRRAIATIAVPRVWQHYTTSRVLTLERLVGTAHPRPRPRRRSTDDERRDLAFRMTDAWMTMIFRHGFFHGDPHPSNILLLDDGRLGLDRLRACRQAHRRGHGATHAAVRRRCDRERRRAATPARRPRGPVSEGARGRASRRVSTRSTTATTGRGSPRSTRSR